MDPGTGNVIKNLSPHFLFQIKAELCKRLLQGVSEMDLAKVRDSQYS